MLKKLLHIGIMVEDFEQAVEKFKGFGMQCSEIKEDKKIDLQIAFLSIGEVAIELLHYVEDVVAVDVAACIRCDAPFALR